MHTCLLIALKAYVTQETLLMATLTVTEAVHYSAQLQLPDSVPPADKRERADRAIKQMGLAAVAGHPRAERVTVVATMHQPSSEVFQLFHGLCLMAYGRMVYFGPASDAIQVHTQ
jgi:ABC-type multidrug transport system ATPase subunit